MKKGRTLKHANERLAQAERKISLLEKENRKLKSDRDASPVADGTLSLPTLRLFLHEYGALVDAADPTRGRNMEVTSKSATVSDEGDATQRFRGSLLKVDRDLVRLTRRVQEALHTPPEERVTSEDDGRCVACGRIVRQTRIRTWHQDDKAGAS